MTFLLSILAACTGEPPTHATLPALPERLTHAETPAGELRPFREAILAVTGEVQGEIEPCGCPTTPFGGFARRERLLSRARDMGPPVFVLDAGAMLLKGSTATNADDRRLRGETVLDLAESTGLDAWAPDPTDLVPGGVALIQGHHVLSANWLAPDGSLAFPSSTIIDRGGVKLGVVGLSAPVDGLGDRDAPEAVAAAMQGEADLWVVLSNAGPETNRRVAALPGVGLILATPGEIQEDPDTQHGAPIVEMAPRGRFLTFLHLSLATSPRVVELTHDSPWKELANTRERGVPMEPSAVPGWRLALERSVKRVSDASAGRNFAFLSAIPLASDLDDAPGTPDVAAKIAAFQKQTLVQAKVTAEATHGPRYAGVGTCGGCHSDRLAQWIFDPHAKALDALTESQKSADPECVGCHTTGFGKAGGFSSLEPAQVEPYKGVQCEACHGPMGGHSRFGDLAPAPIREQTCRTCHDPANSPQFDYSKYLARISCSRVASGGKDDPGAVTPLPKLPAPR